MRDHTCKQCNLIKQRKYVGDKPNGNPIFIDENNKPWIGYLCYNCHLINVKTRAREKKAKLPKKEKLQWSQPKPTNNIFCITCNKCFLPINFRQTFCSVSCRPKRYYKRIPKYKVNNCKVCGVSFKPVETSSTKFCSKECLITNRHNKYIPKPKSFSECRTCGCSFEKNKNLRYCSKACIPKHKSCYKPNPRSKNKLTCPICLKEFLGGGNAIYCSIRCGRHSPSGKESRRRAKRWRKRLSELRKDNRLPQWADKEAIKNIYLNKPPGMEIDHIVPLNNPNVCGLHVEYNLQYLSKEDNMSKSNKFDGTSENESWRLNNDSF